MQTNAVFPTNLIDQRLWAVSSLFAIVRKAPGDARCDKEEKNWKRKEKIDAFRIPGLQSAREKKKQRRDQQSFDDKVVAMLKNFSESG